MPDILRLARRIGSIAQIVRTFAPHSILAVAALALLLRRIQGRPSRALITYIDPDKVEEFDFVIVGGGTAGCVLAARLSEHAHLRVLVIEAGQSSNSIPESTTPAAFLKMAASPHDYNLFTVPQTYAGNKKKFLPRARLLGGCTAVNALIAHYGPPSDYDECATLIGDDSWSWKNLAQYFRKFENYTPDPRFPHVDASLRGSNGPVTVGYNAHIWEGSPLFVQACINAGIPFNPDFNTSKGTLGTNKTMTYIDRRGKRVSTESAYLTPDVLARSNLKVVTHARVTRIIFDSSSGTPHAVGVEFSTSNKNGPRIRVKARKEVIVCGGSIYTPQMLMLSGIGPSSLLKKYDIPVLVDAPGVGDNLTDHPAFFMQFGEKRGISLNYFEPYDIVSTTKFFNAVLQYKIFGRGPFSSNVGEALAFLRTDDQRLFPPAEYNNDIEDSTSAPNAPDIELIIVPFLMVSPEPGMHGYTIAVNLLRPTSAGSIQIKSADPWDDPLIDPNYLATKHDIDVLIRGVRLADRIAHTAPLSDITDTVPPPHPALDHHLGRLTDKELGEIIRDRAETLSHQVGTCKMGKDDDPTAVLDAQMRVRGTVGLRVCDASIYPKLVSGHTTASVLAAAEKLADILKVEY